MNESIREVFEHWKETMGHKFAAMDQSRTKVIRGRLTDGYSVEALCVAIDGCRASAWHMGENDRGVVYDSLTLILRDADHVDKFIRAGEHAHRVIGERIAKAAEEKPATVPSEEQKEQVRRMLAQVKLKRVA